MKSPRIPMTFEDYDRMAWRFGWKHEYWDGCAHLTPRETHICVSRHVKPQTLNIPSHINLHQVLPEDAEGLIECFIATFEDGVEFCNWQTRDFHKHAHRNITDFFADRRGVQLKISRYATLKQNASSSTNTTEIIAAALFTEKKPCAATLDLLMVRPAFHRQGIADALVIAALNDLHKLGYTMLRSAHIAANVESTAWHRAFGFVEEPDLFIAELRRSFYRHESSRYKDTTDAISRREYARLNAAFEFWKRRVEELEALRDRDGYEAVTPILRDEW